MIKIFLNKVDITQNVDTGLSFVEKLDVELDEGQIQILHVERKKQYNLLDTISIYDSQIVNQEEVLKLLFSGRIISDSVSLSSYSSELYNHDLSLIEHTKILEKYYVQGKTFTQPTPPITYENYTLLNVVEILKDTTPLETVNIYPNQLYRVFQIPQETADLLDGIIAPEFNFKGMNLREALDQVASVIDGIVRLDQDGNLIIDRFNDLKNLINGEYIHYKLEQNINYYGTNLQTDVLNPVHNIENFGDANKEVYPAKNLFTTLRSNDYIFNFLNSYIPTFNKIYDVEKLTTVIRIKLEKKEDDGTIFNDVFDDLLEFDITDRIVEKQLYEALDLDETLRSFNYAQNSVIFYEYGRKNISVGQTIGIYDTQSVLKNVVELSALEKLRELELVPLQMDRLQGYFDQEGNEWRLEVVNNNFDESDILFRVHYIPIPSSIFYQVEKNVSEDVKYFTSIGGNQKSRIVDINDFADNLRSRVNRMGNSELQLSQRIKDDSLGYNVGDFTEDKYVITTKETVVDRDFYTVNYGLSRDFNKISQFIGLDQEIRQWEIGESGRTLERDLIYNEFIEVSLVDGQDNTQGKNTFEIAEEEYITAFLTTFDNTFGDVQQPYTPVLFSTIRTDPLTNTDVSLVPINKISGGNTISFSFNLETNASVSNQLIDDGNRQLNYPVRYTDKSGRFDVLKLKIYNTTLDEPTGTIEQKLNGYIDVSDDLPSFDESSLQDEEVFEGDFYVKKDNREVIKFNLMYHILSKSPREIIVGEATSSNNSWINEFSSGIKLRAYRSDAFENTNSLFTEKDRENISNYTDFDEIVNPDITVDYINQKIILNYGFQSYSAWALVDNQNRPYFIVNGQKNVIKFDFVNKRSDIKYDVFEYQVEEVDLTALSNAITTNNVTNQDVEEINLIARSLGTPFADYVFEEFEAVALQGISNASTIIDFTTEIFPNADLIGQSVSSGILDFTTDIIPDFNFIAQSDSQGVLDFNANINPSLQLIAQATSKGLTDFNQEAAITLSAQSVSSPTINFDTSEFEKVWVSKTLSGPFDITLDLGEVSSCPGVLQARDELESAFPAASQQIGDKGNVTSYKITNGFLDPCSNYTYEVEVE